MSGYQFLAYIFYLKQLNFIKKSDASFILHHMKEKNNDAYKIDWTRNAVLTALHYLDWISYNGDKYFEWLLDEKPNIEHTKVFGDMVFDDKFHNDLTEIIKEYKFTEHENEHKRDFV